MRESRRQAGIERLIARAELDVLTAEMDAARSMAEINGIAGRMAFVLNDKSPSRGFGRVGERHAFGWWRQLTSRMRRVK